MLGTHEKAYVCQSVNYITVKMEVKVKVRVRVKVIYVKAKHTQVSLIYLTTPTSFQELFA